MRLFRNTLRVVLPVLVVMTAAGIGVSAAVTRTAQAWFESELNTRARLAANAAGQSILRAQRSGDETELRHLLDDIVRDERVVASAVCNDSGRMTSSTVLLPRDDGLCGVPAGIGAAAGIVQSWNTNITSQLSGQVPVHVSVIPVSGNDGTRASLVVLQDLVLVRERESLLRRGALVLLAVLAVASWLLTVASARLTSIRLVRQVSHALRGEWLGANDHGHDAVLLEDVRAMAQRSAASALEGDHDGRWTRARLRHVLSDHVREDGLVIVANREPCIHERTRDGHVEVRHPASGLVTALEPVIRACSGTWIAHGSGSADRDMSDRHAHFTVPSGDDRYVLRRIWMTAAEEQGYYYGFANEGLWPICHLAYARPTFRTDDWRMYRRINQRFADAVVEEVTIDDPIVLVQDYHLALAPRMIRDQLPHATIIAFWHIPWPNAERFGVCPWRDRIIDGLLGSSIVGFHTAAHCRHFIEAVDTYAEARIDRVNHSVIRQGATTLVRPYPISVEWPLQSAETAPPPAECRRQVFQELNLQDDALLAVGVDRLDYTKGIEERVEAIELLLERRPELRGRFTFAQLAAPSRTRIPRYQQLQDAVELSVQRINDRFGQGSYRPVVLMREHHEPERVFRYYRAANLCYVSSLHDGMNLVSKEFVAARSDEQGVLVLSRFAGAAEELADALIVNPYDLEEASLALERACYMSSTEQAARMRMLRAVVAEHNVYRWAGRMLLDAAQVRHRARRSVQLAYSASRRATSVA